MNKRIRTYVSLILYGFLFFMLLEGRAFSGIGEKHFLKRNLTSLQHTQLIEYENLYDELEIMKETDARKAYDYEYFAVMKKFVDVYRRYDANEMKIDALMTKMAADPVKYSQLLVLSVDKIGQREHHDFYDIYYFSKKEMDLLNKLYTKFPHHKEFASVLIYITKHKTYYTEETVDAFPEPSAPPAETYETVGPPDYNANGSTYIEGVGDDGFHLNR